MSREELIINRVVETFELDLSGLVILTEAASGAYSLNPLIAAQAGAFVYCIAKDSKFGKSREIEQKLLKDAKQHGLESRIEVVFELNEVPLSELDIVTNSGFVRPIDRELISKLKETCVIPLMWETWEFRHSDFDIFACKENNILCLGTNESSPPLLMDPYAGILAVKLLFELQLEVYKTRIVLVGENKFASRIASYLELMGSEVHLFSKNTKILNDCCSNIYDREDFNTWFTKHGLNTDVILLADLESKECFSDSTSLLAPSNLVSINPQIKVGILAGVVDCDLMNRFGVQCFPQQTMPAHFMSYQLYDVGPLPIMELFAAGLKVGEVMARFRLGNFSVLESAKRALEQSPLVMDFEGELSWI